MALPLYYTHQLIIFIIIYNLKMNHIKPESNIRPTESRL